MAPEHDHLLVNQGTALPVRVTRRLPDFLNSVHLKYVKLGYHHLVMHGFYLAVIPAMALVLIREEAASYELTTVLGLMVMTVFSLSFYALSRPRSIYLLDFACYKPSDEFKVSREEFIQLVRESGKVDEQSLEFQQRVLENSGIGDETYVPKWIGHAEKTATMKKGRAEAETVIFGALDELFEKSGVNPKDVRILIVNCSLFNPTPSLSAMVVNHYKMRRNVLSFNLGGMGCSAGVIALDLARDMLEGNPSSYAVVVSTELVGYNWYQGNDRAMLIPNCYFRMGSSALLLCNRRRDHYSAKYKLQHIVRTHKGADDRSFRCIREEEDDQKFKGIKISTDVIEVGGEAIKTNITTLGPLVLPFSEQAFFFTALIWKLLFAHSNDSQPAKPYIPDYKLAFDHFCLHAPSKMVLDELRRNLKLSDENMEASRATLHRFGNTSSSSIWYALSYLESKGCIRKGNRVWQIAFGSGFKCNSVVWQSMRRIKSPSRSPWLDCINTYPRAEF